MIKTVDVVSPCVNEFKEKYFLLCKEHGYYLQSTSGYVFVSRVDSSEKVSTAFPSVPPDSTVTSMSYEAWREKFIPNWRDVPSSGWNDPNEGWYYDWLSSGYCNKEVK